MCDLGTCWGRHGVKQIQFLDMPLGNFVLSGSAFLMIPWACLAFCITGVGKISDHIFLRMIILMGAFLLLNLHLCVLWLL